MLRLHNTLTRQFENFVPLSGEKVTLYTCGPTVYDNLHVGNWAAYVYWDTLVRILQIDGFTVDRVMNITDVGHLVSDADEGEDKLEKGARRENKTAWEIADHYTQKFLDGMRELNLVAPTHIAKATDYISQQISLVRALKQRGCTYQTSDGIYFDTSRFPHYADFAQLDLHAQKAGARVDANSEKRQPWDFALWKFTEPGKVRDMEWETPIDLLDTIPSDNKPIMGFPGWHLECSAIAMSLLGKTIDIHTGGIDHIPVHHTNEIAQSEAKTGKIFANYWMHNGFVNIDNVKMSKSLGNFITVHDALKTIDGQVLRFFFATQHYRKPINFTEKAVRDAETNLKYLKNTYEQPFTGTVDAQELQAFKDKFVAAMDEDFNSANGITVVFEMAKWINSGNYDAAVKQALAAMLEVFGIVFVEEVLDAEIEDLIQKRQEARANRDFATADQIRDQLAAQGIKLLDTKDGVRWTRD